MALSSSGRSPPPLLPHDAARLRLRRTPLSAPGHRWTSRSVALSAAASGWRAEDRPAFSLKSQDFASIREAGVAFVDKTGPLADLLASPNPSNPSASPAYRCFFHRPRKFGKSLTLNIAAHMLGAGQLPAGAQAWQGYRAVDVDALFGGLEVHRRFTAGDPALGLLLRQAHFVVSLSLDTATTGAELRASIIEQLAMIAGTAFGDRAEQSVAGSATAGSALRKLVSAVPSGVPVAVLVDEYDAAIVQDVSLGRWEAADEGLGALRSLFVASKGEDRIARFVVTGVASFALASLFSGANHFTDLTVLPVASRVLGFSESEIRGTFGAELARLAESMGCSVDACVEELQGWYNGYCFDGSSTCYNPFPVLQALHAGRLTTLELEGAASTDWLGRAPAQVLDDLDTCTIATAARPFDIADVRARTVQSSALLLQTGLLTRVPGNSGLLRPPNKYARSTFLSVTAAASALPGPTVNSYSGSILAALRGRLHADFQAALARGLCTISSHTVKSKPAPKKSASTPPPREAPFHTFLQGLLLGTVTDDAVVLTSERAGALGDADIVLQLQASAGVAASTWIVELGCVKTKAPTAGSPGVETLLEDKLLQGKSYAGPFSHGEVLVCSLVVGVKMEPVFLWERSAANGGPWERFDASKGVWAPSPGSGP